MTVFVVAIAYCFRAVEETVNTRETILVTTERPAHKHQLLCLLPYDTEELRVTFSSIIMAEDDAAFRVDAIGEDPNDLNSDNEEEEECRVCRGPAEAGYVR